MLEEAKRTLMSLMIASTTVSTTASSELDVSTNARVLRGNGQWQHLLAQRLREKLLNTTTTTTTRTRGDHSNNNVTAIKSIVTTVVGGNDVLRSMTLFLDCLYQCGTVYGDFNTSNDEDNEYEVEGDGVERSWKSNSNSDHDRECDSGNRYWEPLIPCQNALLLAVEAATCILSLDTTTSPIVVALPIETQK